jgi:SAM-dependent methyltransferase
MGDGVRGYYAHLGEREWGRLDRPEGLIEWDLTCRALEAHLPPAARVLDLGGGPGRYARWLAERGHAVVLADLSPELLEIAKQRLAGVAGIEAIVEADACDLARWETGEFGAVVALGPFYHLADAAQRDRAAAELARVLGRDGIAVISCMPRWSFLRRTLSRSAEVHRILDPEFVRRLVEDGAFDGAEPGQFTGGYGFAPAEVAPYFERFGLAPIALIAAEGMSSGIEDAIAATREAPALYQRVIDLLWQTAAEPSVLGTSSHMLLIARRE